MSNLSKLELQLLFDKIFLRSEEEELCSSPEELRELRARWEREDTREAINRLARSNEELASAINRPRFLGIF